MSITTAMTLRSRALCRLRLSTALCRHLLAAPYRASAPRQFSSYSPPTMRHHSSQVSPSTLPKSPPLKSLMEAAQPEIHSIFEPKTSAWQYIVADPSTSSAVVIDPVLDYDAASRKISTVSADYLLSLIREKKYKVEMILETHAHADHITAASYLQARLAAEERGSRPQIGIGARINQVQKVFGDRYGILAEKYSGVFGKLFHDDETFSIGKLTATAIHLPGHTPDHMGYRIGDNIFIGDTIFHTDIGTARTDFPGGDASHLFTSASKLLAFPDNTRLWFGHDYPAPERGDPVPCLSVGEHKQQNKHLKVGTIREEFVEMRKDRDRSLSAPRLLHPSLQMNICAGRLPTPAVVALPLGVNGVRVG